MLPRGCHVDEDDPGWGAVEWGVGAGDEEDESEGDDGVSEGEGGGQGEEVFGGCDCGGGDGGL